MKISNDELIGTFLNTSILSSFDNSYHDKCCELMGELLSRLKRGEEAERKYQELIYAVGQKFDGETRHETALRYITERENSHCLEAKQSDSLTREERK